jgi:hypothetical protein
VRSTQDACDSPAKELVLWSAVGGVVVWSWWCCGWGLGARDSEPRVRCLWARHLLRRTRAGPSRGHGSRLIAGCFMQDAPACGVGYSVCRQQRHASRPCAAWLAAAAEGGCGWWAVDKQLVGCGLLCVRAVCQSPARAVCQSPARAVCQSAAPAACQSAALAVCERPLPPVAASPVAPLLGGACVWCSRRVVALC